MAALRLDDRTKQETSQGQDAILRVRGAVVVPAAEAVGVPTQPDQTRQRGALR